MSRQGIKYLIVPHSAAGSFLHGYLQRIEELLALVVLCLFLDVNM